ncbi:MAG: hypothetical protein JRJ85_09830 [Deltaproteobacteria bacterium]|nr:hypothetical protein [Deltaproteobacteria bacterium]
MIIKSAAAATLFHCGTVADPGNDFPLEMQTLRIETGKTNGSLLRVSQQRFPWEEEEKSGPG